MKALSSILLAFAVSVFAVAPSRAAETSKDQTACPLSGKPINKEVYTDQDGKRVYFCCPGCVDKFKAEPAKFIKKMAEEGVKLADAPMKMQTECPVSGKPINKEHYADHNGKRVYFCCPHCPDTFKKDPEALIKKIEAQGIMLEKTPKKSEG